MESQKIEEGPGARRVAVWKRPRVRWGLVAAAVVVLGPYGFSRAMSPWRMLTVHRGESRTAAVNVEGVGRGLRVAAFNMAHGRGVVDQNYNGESVEERQVRLDQIAQLLREIDADVVVLNEVDFDSHWSHGVNQAAYLAEKAGYPHRVEQRNLDFRVLWMRWRFGNAVLSRRPIVKAEVIEVPGYSVWETLLAGQKRCVACEVAVDGRNEGETLWVVGAHLCHRSESVRADSARAIVDWGAKQGSPVVTAGDLNSTPEGFPGSQLGNRGDSAVSVFDDSGRYQRLPSSKPTADQLSFPNPTPEILIDWILVPPTFHFDAYRVVPTLLSDHRPVVADLSFEVGSR